MQLVIGTYERFLLGYKLPEELEGPCQLQRSFTHAAHQGPVRCLDAGGPWLVSGGQDDQLHIYDIKAGKDLGFMMNPGDGAITCVKLFTPPGATRPSHLLSGSDDGSIAIWQAGGDWEALKLLRGHKGPIRGLSVHPSGRLAVSVGHDRLLKLWHLGKGRCSYSARLEVEADDVAFSADGESYALLCDKLVTLHTVAAEGGLVAKLQHDRRVTALLLPPPNISAAAAAAAAAAADGSNAAAAAADGGSSSESPLLLSGLDDGRLCLWDISQPEAPVWQLPQAHKARIRAITAVVPGDTPSCLPRVLATASSDGVIKLWDSSTLGSSSSGSSGSNDGSSSERLRLLGSVSTNGRITGMVLSAPDRPAAAAAAVDAGAQGAAAAVAAGTKAQKKSKKKQKVQQQQQGEEGGTKPAKKQRLQQQQPQKAGGKPQQQQQQQRPKQKQKHQGQRNGPAAAAADDDFGFEVVPAVGATAETPQAARQQQQHQQQQRPPKQQQQRQELARKQSKGKQQQQQQQQAANGATADGALVPRVTTIIKKKKQKAQQQRAGPHGAAAAGRGRGSKGGSRGKKPGGSSTGSRRA